jgi:hypothetical protein
MDFDRQARGNTIPALTQIAETRSRLAAGALTDLANGGAGHQASNVRRRCLGGILYIWRIV